MTNCPNESVLQAYVDGELSSEKMERVAAHLAACRECSFAVQEVEAELEMLSTAIGADILAPVPTQVLQSRIYEAISEVSDRSEMRAGAMPFGFIRRWFSGFAISPRAVYACAGSLALILICGAAGAVFVSLKDDETTNVADLKGPNGPGHPGTRAKVEEEQNGSKKEDEKRESEGGKRKRSNMRRPETTPRPMTPMAAKPLPGEASYSEAIASLTEAINGNEAGTLKPSVRAEYERNLAIVDQAIAATKRTARENPKDADAAAFLYASYQNKLDLLATVADQRFTAAR